MAAPAFVQGAVNSNTSTAVTTLSQAFTSSNTAGNTIIVIVASGNAAGTIATPTDSRNTYHPIPNGSGSSAAPMHINAYYAANIGAGANTVQVTWSAGGADFADLWIVEVSGADHSNPIDVATTAFDTTGTSATLTATVTCTWTGDLLIDASYVDNSVSAIGSGFTQQVPSAGNDANGNALATKAGVSVGSQTGTMTENPAGNWGFSLIALRQAAPVTNVEPDRMPTAPRAQLEPGEFMTQRVVAAAVPTRAYTYYPDMMPRQRGIHMEPSVFVGFIDAIDTQGADWHYPDRIDRPKPTPDHVTTVRAPERTAPYSDQDFPDRLVRQTAAPDTWGVWSIQALTVAPKEGYWGYPDRVVRALSTPDWWTLVGKPEERLPGGAEQAFPDRLVRSPGTTDGWTLAGKPESRAPYSDQDFPYGVLRARAAPDWSPTVGTPERTAPYNDQDFPDRVLRAKPTPDERVLWPFPLPTLAAPVEGYWSYPDKLVRAPGTPDAWTTVQRPERTTPEAAQSYPDRLTRLPATPDWSPTTGRPEERVPDGWVSYPDAVLRARGGPDWSPTQGLPVVVTPTAWASYPDTLVRAKGAPDWSPTTGAPEERLPRGWSSYPDQVLRSKGTPDWTVLGDTRPIATPATPAWFPDVVVRAQATVPWDQAFAPQVIIPSARFIVWLGPKAIIVPVLAGAVILPVLGKPTA